jgi:hypothetical protein
MRRATTKTAIVLLILAGGLLGYWLARENQKLFELPYPEESIQKNAEKPSGSPPVVAIGMDTWQVEEVLGPPDERHVISAAGEDRKEEWRYGNKRLLFTNGFLISQQ